MTVAESDFLILVKTGFLDYCKRYGTNSKFGNKKDSELDQNRVILLAAYVEMITYYLRDTLTGDDNWCDADEAQLVVDHINNIMNSHYYLDFS